MTAATLIRRMHNPRNRHCGCDPDCWCRRTAVGRAVKWWFPGRILGLQHKAPSRSPEWKRQHGVTDVVRVVGAEPIFVVRDVSRAVAHYERLGFTSSYHDEGYAFAHRNDLTIHLAGVDRDSVAGGGSLYIHVDDADELADDWRNAGIEFEQPRDYEYGKREGRHVDPDGNVIRFGSPLRR